MTFEIIDKTELYLTGDIGFEISAKRFIEDLKQVNTPNILVHIDSVGGKIFDGLSIYNALKDYKGKTIAIIDGVCMSAASYILMAFDRVIAKPNSIIMVHNPKVDGIDGDSKRLAQMANTLAELTSLYVKTYVDRTGMSEEQIRQYMDNETFFTATEALSNGFIDEIDQTSNQVQLSKDTLKAQLDNRLVAFANHLKNKQSIIMENINETKQEYTVDEAQAVLNTAKEVNTQEAYKLALEQINEAIKDIEDKTPFENIIKELTALIQPEKETTPEAKEEQVVEEQPEQELQQLQAKLDNIKAILALLKEIDDDSLNEVAIKAIENDETLEDFKTDMLKAQVVAKAKTNFKAMLNKGNKQVQQSITPIFKRKSDYIAHYNSLVESGNTSEASSFYKQHSHIF